MTSAGGLRARERGAVSTATTIIASVTVSLMFLVWLWVEAARQPEAVAAHSPVVESVQRSDGRLVDATTGRPIYDGRIVVVGGRTSSAATSSDGSFALQLTTPALVRARARGYSPRVVALAPGQQPTIGLLPRTSESLSLRFGGDVMLGRRFYEPTDRARAWLEPGADVSAHEAPLRQIAPLLGDADLTVVNLETALVDRPYFTGGRPRSFNQEKDLVFASGPQTAIALKESGVDVVDLGNNHVYDALAPGLTSTIEAVEGAGLVHFGAGRTLAEAWAPAYVSTAGQRVAFIGCTTVTGEQYEYAYVVRPGQGGAAACDPALLARAVSRARDRADVVVVMMHGGVEYQPTQDDQIRALSEVAADAGATLVVNGHPHVVGGFTQEGDTPIAETMGNLMFDQNLWSTLRSYLLRVDLADGTPVRTSIDPFALSNYAPVPTTGAIADSAARTAAGLLPGPMLLGVGTASTSVDGTTPPRPVTGRRGTVATIPAGLWLSPGQAQVTPGQDLLFGTGGFEKMDTNPASRALQPMLWGIGKYTHLSTEAACTGTRGLHLGRKPGSDFDVIATPLHRVPVAPGERLTLTAHVRRATESAGLEVRWYDAMLGASTGVESVDLGPLDLDSGCRQVRLDVTVPDGVVAAQPYLRLSKPGDPKAAGELLADDVRMVRWSAAGAGGRLFDTIRFDATTRARLISD